MTGGTGKARFERALLLGTFDLFHRGHEILCWRASVISRSVVVGVNPDHFVQQMKRKPVESLSMRLTKAQACFYVDLAVVNSGGADSKPCIEVVNPDVLVVGSDWEDKDYLAQLQVTKEWLDERYITVRFFPYTQGVSTTQLIEERNEL